VQSSHPIPLVALSAKLSGDVAVRSETLVVSVSVLWL